MVLTRVTVLLLATLCVDFAEGQLHRDEFQVERTLHLFNVRIDGSMNSFQTTRARTFKGIDPRFALLQDPDVQKDLEFTQDQENEIEKMLETYTQLRRKFIDSRPSTTSTLTVGERQNVYMECRLFFENSENRMNELLLPFQEARLEELERQFTARIEGLIQYLERPEIQETIGVVAAEDRKVNSAIVEAIDELMDELESEVADQIKDSNEALLGVLENRQRKKLESVMGQQYLIPQTNAEILIWQLDYDPERFFRDASTPLRSLANTPRFELRDTGKFHYIKASKSDNQPGSAMAMIGPRLSSDQFPDAAMTLTHKQVDEIRRIYQQRSDAVTDLNTEVLQNGLTKQTRELWIRQVQEQYAEMENELTNVLSPGQQRLLQEFATKVEPVRHGYVAAFVDGKLGEELDITNSQKEEIRKIAKTTGEELKEMTLKWEEKVRDVVVGCYSTDDQKKIDEYFGSPVKVTSGNTGRMIRLLKEATGQ